MAVDVNAELAAVVAASSTALQALGPILDGCGEDVQRSYRTLVDLAAAMPSAGQTARLEIERVVSNDALPKDHRARVVREQQETAGLLVEKLREAAHLQVDALEHALQRAVVPKVATDPTQRLLKRQEADVLVRRAGGKMEVLQALLGRDPQLDAELIDTYGAAMFSADDHGALRAAALARYMNDGVPGTQRQVVARNALKAFYKANLKGRVAGFHQSARMMLSG